MNQITLIGRLTKDPEVRFTGSGKAVANFNLAVNRAFAKEDDKVKVDFFRVTVWGTQAENAGKYLVKGSLIAVQGRIENNNYTDNDGNQRYSTDVQAERIEYLSKVNQTAAEDNYSSGVVIEEADYPLIDDDEVPF